MNVRGFTLVEVLITIGVMVVLIAILLTSLSGARDAGETSASVSNLRQCGILILSSAATEDDTFPLGSRGTILYDSRGAPSAEVRLNGTVTTAMSWFSQSVGWNLILTAKGVALSTVWCSPRRGMEHRPFPMTPELGEADYALTHTVMADPAYFEIGNEQSAGSCRAVRVAEVLYPSQKGMLFERPDRIVRGKKLDFLSYLKLRHPTAFVDGHVDTPEFAGTKSYVGNSLAGTEKGYPVLTTQGGARGRDF